MQSIPSRLLALAAVAALALVAAPDLQAAKQYNAASLKGEYHFTLVETAVTDDPEPVTIYCNGWGRLSFDGIGEVELVDGANLCNGVLSTPGPASWDYTVDPDGAVVLTEQGGDLSETHCQLANNGALLLCDGVYDPPNPDPRSERRLWMATAAKL